jgi:chromosome segregation ATPase
VAELEGRLSRSDAETSDLRKRVETFEEELKHRDDMYRDLEARMALLDTTVDTKQLLSELEGKERKVADLERQLQGALQGRDQVGCEVEKLLEASKLDQVAREELNRQIKELQAARPHNQNAFHTSRTPSSADKILTPSIQFSQPLPGSDEDDLTTPDASDGANGGVSKSQEASLTADFKQQLQELQMRQAATLSELAEVSSRHRDALREIDDLAVQLKEAKLEHVELADVPPSSPSASVPEEDEDSSSSSASLSPRASPRKRNLHGQTSAAGSLYDLGSHQDFQQGRGSSETNRVR